METFKIHIFKKRPDGKLFSSTTECGRGAFTLNGAPNVIFKTNAFKMAFEEGTAVCQNCLNKAKKQGRI